MAEYGRMRAVYFEQADTLQARRLEPGTGLLSRPAHLGWIVGFVAFRAHRRYGYELLQTCPDLSEYRLHRSTDIFRAGPTASRRHQQRFRRLPSDVG